MATKKVARSRAAGSTMPPASETRIKLASTHLDEIKELAADCIEKAIELLPDGENMPSPDDARITGIRLLQHLRAIQQEAEMLEKERP